MSTLGDLRASLLPTAEPVAPIREADLAREVAWVRVLRARVPALEALGPGDLAIAPAGALAVVAPGPAEAAELVREFVAARAAGVLLVAGDPDAVAGSDALEALGRAAVDAGVPAFRLGRLDVAALERSVIGFLVNRQAELDRQAGLLEARLETLALEGADLVGLVAAIGGSLGRAVALEGRRGDALAVHAPADLPGAADDVRGYLARPRAVALRIALPAQPGAHGRRPTSSGSLALLGARPASPLERSAVDRIAALLALELVRAESVRRAGDVAARRGDALPTDGPPWVVLLAEQATPGIALTIDQRDELRRELRLLAPARRLGLRGDAESLELRVVLAVGRDDPAGIVLAGRIAAFLGRGVGVSRPFDDPSDRPAAEAEARATLEAARGLPAAPRVARADRLNAYRLLGGLHNLSDGPRQARLLLDPLLATASREEARRARLETLRALLDHPSPGEAAAALGVHRNTIAYRVRRLEAETGWDLADPELRLALGIAVRIMQSAQS